MLIQNFVFLLDDCYDSRFYEQLYSCGYFSHLIGIMEISQYFIYIIAFLLDCCSLVEC